MRGHDEIDFNGIDEDLEQFQQDDIVRQALLQGVDLRGYARDIDLELREVTLMALDMYFLVYWQARFAKNSYHTE